MSSFELRRYGPKNNYYIFWSEGGRSKRASTRTPNHELAKKRHTKFVRDYLAALEGDTVRDVYLHSVLDAYGDERGSVVESQASLISSIKSLKRFYGPDVKVTDLKPRTHLAYEKHCRDVLGHKNSTINQRRIVLVTALNYAHDNGVITNVPAVPMLPKPPRKERFLSRDEAMRMFRAAKKLGLPHVLLFLRIGLYTGARTTAILQLTWDRVDCDEGKIDFRLPEENVTNKRRPNTHLNFRLLRAFRALKKQSRSPYVVTRDGKRLKSILKDFKAVASEAGVEKVTPHTTKHTAITWMLHNRVTPWQVSGITATNLETIMKTYGHHVPDDLKEAVNQVRIRRPRGAQ